MSLPLAMMLSGLERKDFEDFVEIYDEGSKIMEQLRARTESSTSSSSSRNSSPSTLASIESGIGSLSSAEPTTHNSPILSMEDCIIFKMEILQIDQDKNSEIVEFLNEEKQGSAEGTSSEQVQQKVEEYIEEEDEKKAEENHANEAVDNKKDVELEEKENNEGAETGEKNSEKTEEKVDKELDDKIDAKIDDKIDDKTDEVKDEDGQVESEDRSEKEQKAEGSKDEGKVDEKVEAKEEGSNTKNATKDDDLKITWFSRNLLDLGANIKSKKPFLVPAQIPKGVQSYFEHRSQISRIQGAEVPPHDMVECTDCDCKFLESCFS